MRKDAQPAAGNERRARLQLLVLCLGFLLIATNATMVMVALPSVKVGLGFSDATLSWVINAYMAAFGAFLLLGGRLGDLLGHRRIFLLGIALFTAASFACGLATLEAVLVAARFVQGASGAIVSAVALSLITGLFADSAKQTRALGVCSFMGASGGCIGTLLGGAVTNAVGWRGIFLASVLVGLGTCALAAVSLQRGERGRRRGHLDIAAAVVGTSGLMLAVFGIVSSSRTGWASVEALVLLAGGSALLIVFVRMDARAQTPLIPTHLLRVRNLAIACIAGALLAAAVLAWNFVSALYLQFILSLSPLQVGLAFLPPNLLLALTSFVVSPALVARFGTKLPAVIGMLVVSAGLALLGRAPATGDMMIDVFPGMMFVGLGSGLAYSPLLVSALNSVARADSGAASGIVNTAYMIGGSLGLSLLASVVAARTSELVASGIEPPLALSSGYQIAFFLGAALAALAAVITWVFLRVERRLWTPIDAGVGESCTNASNDAQR